MVKKKRKRSSNTQDITSLCNVYGMGENDEQHVLDLFNENHHGIAPTLSSSSTTTTTTTTPKKKRPVGRPKKNSNTKDTSSSSTTTTTKTNNSNVILKRNSINVDKPTRAPKKRKVIKDLPTSASSPRLTSQTFPYMQPQPPSSNQQQQSQQQREGESTGMMQASKVGEDPPNLQRYYRTELLTSQEEYTLGMQIQFLTKCEEVHEGLYLQLQRLPSIAEWSHACGFTEEDYMSHPNYVEKESEYQIRPSNSEALVDGNSLDPNMFVGNGLVNESGPGRGRGRARQPYPTSLDDFYDDSSIKFAVREDGSKVKKEEKNLMRELMEPINRGTPEEFVELMLEGKEAKQRMVQCNMRLVVSISKRYKHVGVNIADLVQEGSIGLARAAEKFDPKKGFKFSTYASWWIQQAVFRSIAYHSRTIRLPVHVHNLLNRVRRVRQELQRVTGRTPTNEEMAKEMDMSLEKYIKMLRLTRKAISLDISKYQNNPKDMGQESDTSLGDTIDAAQVIKDENTPEQSVDQTLFRDDLQEMLNILGDDERAVISARYGLKDGLTRTVTTVAAQMGQTKSWVRSQECRALRKLRRPWYEKRLWEHKNSLSG